MTFLAFLFILISLVTFVAAQLILKKAMEFSATDGMRNSYFTSRVAIGVRSNDGFLFPDARPATALRSELSLSFPRLERDLYHDSRRGGVERKTKRASHHRRAPDHRRNCACFDELTEL